MGESTPHSTPPAQGGGGHLFTQSQAAQACGVSTSTIRNARERGRLNFDRAEDGSIRISLAALVGAGFTPKHAGKSTRRTPATRGDTKPHSAAQEIAHVGAQAETATLREELDKLRQEATEWRVRALVAESQAQERKDALDSTRLALRALETVTATQAHTPAAQDTTHASTPDVAEPRREAQRFWGRLFKH